MTHIPSGDHKSAPAPVDNSGPGRIVSRPTPPHPCPHPPDGSEPNWTVWECPCGQTWTAWPKRNAEPDGLWRRDLPREPRPSLIRTPVRILLPIGSLLLIAAACWSTYLLTVM